MRLGGVGKAVAHCTPLNRYCSGLILIDAQELSIIALRYDRRAEREKGVPRTDTGDKLLSDCLCAVTTGAGLLGRPGSAGIRFDIMQLHYGNLRYEDNSAHTVSWSRNQICIELSSLEDCCLLERVVI
jgi:hypothetical protein